MQNIHSIIGNWWGWYFEQLPCGWSRQIKLSVLYGNLRMPWPYFLMLSSWEQKREQGFPASWNISCTLKVERCTLKVDASTSKVESCTLKVERCTPKVERWTLKVESCTPRGRKLYLKGGMMNLKGRKLYLKGGMMNPKGRKLYLKGGMMNPKGQKIKLWARDIRLLT